MVPLACNVERALHVRSSADDGRPRLDGRSSAATRRRHPREPALLDRCGLAFVVFGDHGSGGVSDNRSHADVVDHDEIAESRRKA